MSETIHHAGLTIRIEQDSDPLNPRIDFDNAAHMVCWHRRHNLGDKHKFKDPNDLINSLFHDIDLDTEEIDMVMRVALQDPDFRDEYRNARASQRKFFRGEKRSKYDYRADFIANHDLDSKEVNQVKFDMVNRLYLIKPLYLYDHGGITISTGSFSCPWDSGQVGYIYMTPATIAHEWGGDRQKAEACLDAEVNEYDQYIRGDVWGYTILGEDGEDMGRLDDSCWGFFGQEYCIEEAKQSAEHIRSELDKMADQVERSASM